MRASYVSKVDEHKSTIKGLGPLFLLNYQPKTPKWVNDLASLFDIRDSDQRTIQLQGGLIVVEAAKRVFAACFGHGHILLDLNRIEENFGHHISMNLVSKKLLSELVISTPGERSTSRLIQAAKPMSALDFEIHQAQDLLRQVSGKSEDTTIADRVSGTAGLRLATKVTAGELPQLCAKLIEHFLVPNPERLGIMTQIESVTNPLEIEKLEEVLTDRIKNGQTDQMFFFPPEIVDWTEHVFSVSGEKKSYEFAGLDSPELWSTLKGKTELKALLCKKYKLNAVSITDEAPNRSWSLYRCISAEITHDNKIFVFFQGRFFAVNQAFADAVEKRYNVAVSKAPAISTPYRYKLVGNKKGKTPKGPHELQFNSELRESIQCPTVDAHLLDQLNIHYGDLSSVEFCDVVEAKAGKAWLYHTKIILGGYGSISHACRQAIGSLQIYLTRTRFRENLKNALEQCLSEGGDYLKKDVTYKRIESKIAPFLTEDPRQTPNRGSLNLVLLLVNLNRLDENDRTALPFFAKLSICDAIDRAEAMGVEMSVAFAGIEEITEKAS